MANSVKLALKDSPSGTDDFVELATLGSSGYGYLLQPGGMSQSDPYQSDFYKQELVDVTLTITVKGTNVNDMQTKLRKLEYYLNSTRAFFQPFQGNIPATTNGTWFQNYAAVLTVQPDTATYPAFWNVLDGKLSKSVAYLGPSLGAGYARDVTLKLTCQKYAREGRRKLDQGVIMGDFNPPFSLTDAAFNGGWSSTGGTWSGVTGSDVDPTVFGYSYLQIVTGSTATLTSNEMAVATGQVLLPAVYFWGSASPVPTMQLQAWNGSSYSTVLTITPGSISGARTNFTNGTYTVAAGITKVRAVITSTNGAVKIQGVAIWRNPPNGIVPTEYVTGGYTTGVPHVNLYNLRGDAPSPMLVTLKNSLTTANTAVLMVGARNTGIGAQSAGSNVLDAQPPLASRILTPGAADTSLPWGVLGTVLNTSALSTNWSINSNGIPSGISHRYLAVMIYAANNIAAINQVRVYFSSQNKFAFVQNVAQTYATNATPANTDYRAWILGEILYPKRGSFIADVLSNPMSQVFFDHANNANTKGAFSGIILLPREQFGTVVFSNNGILNDITLSSEANTPSATSPGYNDAGKVFDCDFTLTPPNMTFVFLVASAQDGTYKQQLTLPNATTSFIPVFEYSPRLTQGIV